MASDAFIVGEGWISEHYFNTDAAKQSFQARVLQRRKGWDADDEAGHASARSAFLDVRPELVRAFADLEEDGSADDARAALSTALKRGLGFDHGLYEIEQRGAVAFVRQRELDEPAKLVVIDAVHVAEVEDLLQKDADTLAEPYVPVDDESTEVRSASRALTRLFAADDGPAFALVIAGRWLLLTDRERWPEGRWLAVNLQLVVDRNDQKKGGEFDRAVACITAESLLPDAEGTVWWESVFDESVKHTVGVSKDLREGVRASIEIIANEVVRRRAERGLDPLPAEEAQPLAKQALRYLYRILFLLYAEASPELEVLSIGASEYEEGYSLDRLRELVLVELSADAADRTHFFDSLAVLFRLVDQGHRPEQATEAAAADVPEGLTFNSLKADLFLPAATAHIDEVGLGDEAMQKVLAYLLLSKEQRGRDRGFISYSDLGINQLGAVYEGLMSYTGFFATTDLYEVAKDGDASKGSWVVPVERSSGISPKDFVQTEDPITGEKKAVLHERGSFVFRLAGRERQQSASYYTPEVLTRFVVSQALEELLDQDGHTTTAEEILGLTICEPALGSGAFAIEAVRQLAEQYLSRRERELGERVDPEERPKELQRVKAYLALHQVYGVDLNATAVELAEISLWLDTMVAGLQAPWFGLHLKRGNSLIGARRAVYSKSQVSKKTWLKDVPRDLSVTELAENIQGGRVAQGAAGTIHHFLLPAEGWGSAVDFREAKELAPEALAGLKKWRTSIKAKPNKAQLDALVSLAYRVETLWQLVLRRLRIAESEIRREIPLWGRDAPRGAHVVTRAEIESKLGDPNGAYQRLRRVMDAWNALWFWPLTSNLTCGAQPPSLDQWIAGLRALLGEHTETKGKAAAAGQMTFEYASGGWDELNVEERDNLDFASAATIDQVLADHSWLGATEQIAVQHGFFHWELDFATVFERGGFDLQVGNPPWVRPRSDVDALLAEGDPWWQLAVKPTQSQIAAKRAATLEIEGIKKVVIDGSADVAVTAAFVGSQLNYPLLRGQQPDLYRCFMSLTWRNLGQGGIAALIHYETHLTDDGGGELRANAYLRLRRRWDFINELGLFEIQNQKRYGVNIYGTPQRVVDFISASSAYHPSTIEASIRHDGSGPAPGLKDDNGSWDLRPHKKRIIHVTRETLANWHKVLERSDTPVGSTRMVFAVNADVNQVLDKVATSDRVYSLSPQFSRGWDESIDRKGGYFDVRWGASSHWEDVILQGPHIFVGNPFYKSPNPTMLHHRDWSPVDLESAESDAHPITSYKPALSGDAYDAGYTLWRNGVSPRDYYRVAWRAMPANTGERTLTPAIIPPGVTHVHAVASIGTPGDAAALTVIAGSISSLIADFVIRIAPRGSLTSATVGMLPLVSGPLVPDLSARALRLNAITAAWDGLVRDAVPDLRLVSDWTGGIQYRNRAPFDSFSTEWTPTFPLKRDSDRRQALLEIDACVAISLGISADELCTIYRTQFAVLHGYDRNLYFYDANGRLVPNSVLSVWRQKGDQITAEERQAVHPGSGLTYTYEFPFVTLDREADMRQAYAHFERVLLERS